MRSLLLFGAAREQSTRCHNKMLRPFAGTTLYDLYLERLARLSHSGLFARAVIAVAKCDAGLWAKAASSGLEIVERSAVSVAQGIQPRNVELHFLSEFDETHVLYLNPCFPFLPDAILEDAVAAFSEDETMESLTCAIVNHNWFWTMDGRPVNNTDPKCLSTQGCPPLLGSVHTPNIYPRARMVSEGVRWTYKNGDPHVFVLPYEDEDPEVWDVDTEKQFDKCAAEWARRQEAENAATAARS